MSSNKRTVVAVTLLVMGSGVAYAANAPEQAEDLMAMAVQSPRTGIASFDAAVTTSGIAMERLFSVNPNAPGCKEERAAVSITGTGTLNDISESPFSLSLNIVLGPSFRNTPAQPDSTPGNIVTIVGGVSGTLRVGTEPTEWAVSQANFGPHFAKSLAKLDRVSFFLPIRLDRQRDSRSVFATLQAVCRASGRDLECERVDFAFGDWVARSVNSPYSWTEVLPTPKKVKNILAASKAGKQALIPNDCCFSVFGACTCTACAGSGPTCMSSCPNCEADVCFECIMANCDQCVE